MARCNNPDFADYIDEESTLGQGLWTSFPLKEMLVSDREVYVTRACGQSSGDYGGVGKVLDGKKTINISSCVDTLPSSGPGVHPSLMADMPHTFILKEEHQITFIVSTRDTPQVVEMSTYNTGNEQPGIHFHEDTVQLVFNENGYQTDSPYLDSHPDRIDVLHPSCEENCSNKENLLHDNISKDMQKGLQRQIDTTFNAIFQEYGVNQETEVNWKIERKSIRTSTLDEKKIHVDIIKHVDIEKKTALNDLRSIAAAKRHVRDEQIYSKADIDRHVPKEHEYQLFGCEKCGVKFRQRMWLKKHLLSCPRKALHPRITVNGPQECIPCQSCGAQFKKDLYLKVHLKLNRCKGLPQYMDNRSVAVTKCHMCDKQFYSKAKFNRHVAKEHERQLFGCEKCGMKFRQWTWLKEHRRRCPRKALHPRSKVNGSHKCIPCQSCGAQFKKDKYLKAHLQLNHCKGMESKENLQNVKPKATVKCHFCNDRFHNMGDFKLHMTNKHKGQIGHFKLHMTKQCEWCGKIFSRRMLLEKHLINCSKKGLRYRVKVDGPQQCQICGTQFKKNKYLKTHLKLDRCKVLPQPMESKESSIKKENLHCGKLSEGAKNRIFVNRNLLKPFNATFLEHDVKPKNEEKWNSKKKRSQTTNIRRKRMRVEL